MKLFCVLFIFLIYPAFSKEYKHQIQKDGTIVESFDFDLDGFHEYEVKKINLKNKFDINTIKTTFNPKTKKAIKIETYQLEPDLKQELKITKIFDEKAQKFNEFKTYIEFDQKQDSIKCNFSELNDLLGLDSFVNQTLKTLPQKSIETKEGFLLDTACLKNGGGNFLKALENVKTKGLSCLEELVRKGGQGASMNLSQLKSNLAVKKIQIMCDEQGYDWEGGNVLGHATTSIASNANGLRHPGVSIYPNSVKELKTNEEIQALSSTIFHEMLHTNGYRHGDDVEYPEMCASCCFENGEEKDIACKICSTRYDDSNFKNYFKDMSKIAPSYTLYV